MGDPTKFSNLSEYYVFNSTFLILVISEVFIFFYTYQRKSNFGYYNPIKICIDIKESFYFKCPNDKRATFSYIWTVSDYTTPCLYRKYSKSIRCSFIIKKYFVCLFSIKLLCYLLSSKNKY